MRVEELTPGSFALLISAAVPAENVAVRDVKSGEVYAERALDDERVFRIEVPHPLGPDVEVSVSVLQADSINRANFKVSEGR